MPVAKAYYAGGFRAVIGGIPTRLARKPSARDLANMRAWEKEREKPWYFTRQEYAEARAKAANDAIELYADMLEISVTQAKARIAAQRLHELANPTRDLSLEYDL